MFCVLCPVSCVLQSCSDSELQNVHHESQWHKTKTWQANPRPTNHFRNGAGACVVPRRSALHGRQPAGLLEARGTPAMQRYAPCTRTAVTALCQAAL